MYENTKAALDRFFNESSTLDPHNGEFAQRMGELNYEVRQVFALECKKLDRDAPYRMTMREIRVYVYEKADQKPTYEKTKVALSTYRSAGDLVRRGSSLAPSRAGLHDLMSAVVKAYAEESGCGLYTAERMGIEWIEVKIREAEALQN
jgi:hypothetical protein